MPAQPETPSARVMDRIEEERARDRSIRRIARFAWIATGSVVLLWIGLTAYQIKVMSPMMGGLGTAAMLGLATPVLFVLFGLGVLVATLSTIGTFLRYRRATFEEIQLRLAALEELLTRDDASRGAR
jgi:hypothetical protein